MDLLSEYKDLYNNTIEHSERLSNKINISMTQLVAITTGNIFVWREFFTSPVSLIYLILCFISFVSLVVASVLFYRAYSGYTYAYFPTKDMNIKIQQTVAKTKNIKNGKEIADNHISGMFSRTYLKCAIINADENILKTKRHKALSMCLVLAVLAPVIAFAFNIAVMNNIHI